MDTDRTYTGQVSDEALTGLMFYNARYYDPLLRRFISPDTIVPDPGNPQDLNRYTYVRNNPVLYRDDSGHDPDESYLKPAGIGPAQIRQIEHASARAATAMSQIDSIVGQMRTWDPDALLSDSQINTIIELAEAINEYNAAVNTIRKIAPEWLTDLGTSSLDPIPELASPNGDGITWEEIRPVVITAAHGGVSLGAGMLGYLGAVVVCAGTGGAGCVVWATAAIAMPIATVGNVIVAEAFDEEITAGDALAWTVGAGLAGGSSSVTRLAGTGGALMTVLRGNGGRITAKKILDGWRYLD